MAEDTSKKPAAADSPQVAHHKFREKELLAKIERLKQAKPESGFDYEAVIARAEAQLAEHRKAIKEATK